jgi:hypothetical protein
MSADGNNTDDAVRDLEAWLMENPQTNDAVADVPRLRELCQSVWPTEPDEAAWNAALSRIHASLERAAVERSRSRRPLWAILGLTAAAVLAVLLARSLGTHGVARPKQVVEEPFPVAEAEDVTIVSMDARDVAFLVVGEPPVSGDLEFARAEDIRIIKCERCPYSGGLARLEQGDEVPMLVSAAVEQPNDD